MMNVDWRHSRGAPSHEGDGILLTDPVFRHAARCLDLGSVGACLGVAFPELGMDAPPGLVNVWYVPGKSLQVVYRLRRHEGPTLDGDAVARVRFCASPEDADQALRATAARRRGVVRRVPGLRAVATLFPEDEGLPQLADVLTGKGGPPGLKPWRPWSLLSYLPGTRCAVRYGRPSDPDALVLRVQGPEAVARSHALARAAWGAPSRRFVIPEPLGCEPRAGVAWERFAPGCRLDSLGGEQFRPALRAAVEGLVHLHALRLDGLPVEGRDAILKRAAMKVLPKAALALPTLRAGLDEVMGALTAGASELHEQDPVVTHGDLHTANVLVQDEAVVFIDLDRLSRGNAASDLALLGTRLLLVALTTGGDPQAVARVVATLPDVYREAGGRAVDDATFAWYVAAQLVSRQIKTTIRHLAPHAGDVCRTLLTWAQRTLDRGRFDASVITDPPDEAHRADPLAIPA